MNGEIDGQKGRRDSFEGLLGPQGRNGWWFSWWFVEVSVGDRRCFFRAAGLPHDRVSIRGMW